MHYIYVIKELSKKWPGGKQLFENIQLSFLPGAKIGVIGSNGSGKSTLLKIMAGVEKEYSGEAWAAKGTKIGYLEQEPQLDNSKTVYENIVEAMAETKVIVDEFEEISLKLGEVTDNDEMMALIEKQATLQEQIDAKDAWDLPRQIEIAMDALRCPDKDSSVEQLSGGEKRRIALCKLLLEKPDMLLLDEPTNHLDAGSVAWLQKYLEDYPGTVVLITHDRYFLDNVTGWILELDRGQGFPYEGNYTAWLEQKQKRLLQEEREESNRQRSLSEELEWIRKSPKARQSKSKARVNAYDDLLKKDVREKMKTAQIMIPTPERLGDLVIEAKGVSKAFGDKLLIEDLNFKIPRGAIVGIIGPNGAGKTTMLNMITGKEQPTEGEFRIGDKVTLGYVDQSRDSLKDKHSVWQEISDGNDIIELGKVNMQSRAYVASFNFRGGDQQKLVGSLSGGERNRVHLAKMLKSGANVLMLDEPTNDLDVETLRSLEEALMDFAGCILITSHDRWFLDRLCTHILAFEGDSHIEWFEGNYADYEKDILRRFGETATQPHKIKYKPISR